MGGNGATILVVDDHVDLLSIMRLILDSSGYKTVTVSDGAEALQVLHQQPVDLILADIAMPGLDGYQLYRQVRANPAWVHVPFIFLTALTNDQDVRYGKELGVDDYLVKPVDPKNLLATVQGKLRRARQLSGGTDLEEVSPPPALSTSPLVVGRLRINPGQHQVWLGGDPVSLSAREFVLLEYLARRVNRLISPQKLISVTHQLDVDRDEASNLLRPLIRSLRRKLGYKTGEMGCIETVRSVGYRLVPPD